VVLAVLLLTSRRAGTPARRRLRELKRMHDDGLITREEYEAKRRSILERM
jgi:hypothetical protein